MASLQQRAFSVLVMVLALKAVAATHGSGGSIRIRNELDLDLYVRCWSNEIAKLHDFTIPVYGQRGFAFNPDADEYWACDLQTTWVSTEKPGVKASVTLYARPPTFNPGRHSSWLANYDGLYIVQEAGLSPQPIYPWAPQPN